MKRTKHELQDHVRSQQDNVPLVEFLGLVIDALTWVDAETLDSLSQAVERIPPVTAGVELDAARSQHRILGALLGETRRNLRLLQDANSIRFRRPYGRVYQ